MPAFSAERFRAQRQHAALTRERLSVLTGMSYGHIAKIESGGVHPSVPVLGRCAEALGCSVADLFDGDLRTASTSVSSAA